MKRRQYLGGMAGLGAFSALPTVTDGAQSLATTRVAGDSYHPGPPRVMHAGEKLVDPLTTDYKGDGSPDGRNTLSPRVPDPQRDPDNYGPDAFTWHVLETPTDSEVSGFYSTPDEYDYGTDNVEEFDPDVPGTYRLALDAPDGTHHLSVRVFPEPPDGTAGPPRVDPSTTYENGAFTVEANPMPAPDSTSAPGDLTVEFLTDDRDGLTSDAVQTDGSTATIPASAFEGTARIHAVATDGQPGVMGTVELDADAGTATRPDAPPTWIKDATMYEIFTRSFGSKAGQADFEYLTSKVEYLADLGVDVVWLTPIVAAVSQREDNPPGGPNGYDTTNYFETADALGTVEQYEAFVEACHQQDIKVCFDLVINHTDVQHRFFQDAKAKGTDSKYYDWYERKADGTPNHYFGWTDLMNINYQWVAMREHILSVVDFWSDIVDGFRCDIAYGVPHDFWKEVRQLVRAKDTDIFLLDEAIPYGPRFSEGEFDVHFDNVLNEHVRDIGKGGVAAETLLDAIRERDRRGVPEHTLFLQYLENHDMRRYLDVASKEAERAAAGAAFTLPGVPMLYYGQERAIAQYSDPRVDEKGHFRAFMNWDDYDADHLAFYKSLVAARNDLPALQHEAEFVGAYYESASDRVVAYGRDGGEQKVVVVLHFGEGTQEVTLRGPVTSTDLLTNSDVGVDSQDDRTHVEVDSVAVLETPSLSGLGTHVAGLDDETGDDDGPGGYTYPAGDTYADGAFDLTGLDVYETETDYQLRFTVDGPVENPWDYDGGFTVQHVQCYVRDPTDASGSTTPREGLTATMAEPYQYRIVGDGENGARVESPSGDVLAEGSVFASPSTSSIRLDVPKYALPGGLDGKELAPLMLGYDPDAPGNVARVGSSAEHHQFGGGNGENAPEVIDMLTPADRTQSEALSYGDSIAEIPYLVLGNPLSGELLYQWDDPTGDDDGPGSYTYPKTDKLGQGDLDVESFAIRDDGDRYRFVYRFAEDLTDPFEGDFGFSAQHLQLYVENSAASDASTATKGREGTNVAFAEPYTHRIDVTGYDGQSVVEDGSGSVVSEDVTVGAYGELNAITFTVPKSALGGTLDDAAVAPLVFGYDPDGPGKIRQVDSQATEQHFGGADGDGAPAVVDMVTPKSAAQSDVLASGDSLPYLSLAGFSGTLVYSWSDPSGDDHGPGSYTYPTTDQVPEGAYDIARVELYRANGRYRFVYYLNHDIPNPWSGADGFSLQNFQVYVRDPNAGSDVPSGTTARKGVNAKFKQPYNYRIAVNGYSLRAVEAADGSTVSQDVSAQAHPDLNAVAFDVPADVFASDAGEMQYAPIILGHDGYGKGKVRAVVKSAAEWKFGGGRNDAKNSNVIDMITPEGVSQSEALGYSADSQARLPFVPKRETNPDKPTALAESDGPVFATMDAHLDASGSSDPKDQSLSYVWTQTAGPSVHLSNRAAAKPTFTAPDVDEKADLAFQVKVSDPDGNSATASTTVTVRPQSANDAPIAKAGRDRTITAGDSTVLNGANSTDPNGGTLTFHWEQTAGPSVELNGADGPSPALSAPKVSEETTLTFELSVSDGQGKTSTDTTTVTVEPAGDTTTTSVGGTETPGETTTPNGSEPTSAGRAGTTSAGGSGTTKGSSSGSGNGSGSGPGFGVVSGALGTAGGIAYAARHLLAETAQSEDVTIDDVEDEQD